MAVIGSNESHRPKAALHHIRMHDSKQPFAVCDKLGRRIREPKPDRMDRMNAVGFVRRAFNDDVSRRVGR